MLEFLVYGLLVLCFKFIMRLYIIMGVCIKVNLFVLFVESKGIEEEEVIIL